MDFESILLVNRDNKELFNEEFRIRIDNCFNNIKGFYKEGDKIFLILNLEEEYSDEEFENIITEFPYEEFESLGLEIYPKDEEYYPTFIVEMNNDSKENIQLKVDDVLELFMEKIVKFYCNNI